MKYYYFCNLYPYSTSCKNKVAEMKTWGVLPMGFLIPCHYGFAVKISKLLTRCDTLLSECKCNASIYKLHIWTEYKE